MKMCEMFADTPENLNTSFLMASILRMQKQYIKKTMIQLNITKGEFPFLMLLYVKGNKSQKEIADTFIFSEANVAKITRNLEDKNLIKKEVDDNNRRKKIVALTSEGKKTCKKIIETEKEWENQVTKNISNEKKDILKEILNEILKESFEVCN
ncbi:MAG: MarR family transcriptional regulator [Methanosphaera stadtmanae]|jgi:DNA-binding MarR family transcriptional regulator|nr:MarR family transcriptional regulator [Methanosphaera stadtmanae]